MHQEPIRATRMCLKLVSLSALRLSSKDLNSRRIFPIILFATVYVIRYTKCIKHFIGKAGRTLDIHLKKVPQG